METNNKYFWTRPTPARLAARKALMDAGAGWGDSHGEGITVPVIGGTPAAILTAAAQHDLREVGRWSTVVDGHTVLMLNLEG